MHPPMLLIIASSDAHPLIDIDLTLFVQLVIFSVMALGATRLLFRPYLKMKDDRAAGIDGAREDAENLRHEAEARLADYGAKLASARVRGQVEQRKIRGEAAAHQTELTEKARTIAARAMDDARVQIEEASEQARGELGPRADQLARQIVAKLLGREVA